LKNKGIRRPTRTPVAARILFNIWYYKEFFWPFVATRCPRWPPDSFIFSQNEPFYLILFIIFDIIYTIRKKIKWSGGQQGQQWRQEFHSISNVMKKYLGNLLLLVVLVGRRIPLFFKKCGILLNSVFYIIIMLSSINDTKWYKWYK